MKISIDTKEDTHEEIKKVINMLQNLVGESTQILTIDPQVGNIFGNAKSSPESVYPSAASFLFESQDGLQNSQAQEQPSENETPNNSAKESESSDAEPEDSRATDDLFAELFSEEELKKMDVSKEQEDDAKHNKKYSIELY